MLSLCLRWIVERAECGDEVGGVGQKDRHLSSTHPLHAALPKTRYPVGFSIQILQTGSPGPHNGVSPGNGRPVVGIWGEIDGFHRAVQIFTSSLCKVVFRTGAKVRKELPVFASRSLIYILCGNSSALGTLQGLAPHTTGKLGGNYLEGLRSNQWHRLVFQDFWC